MWILDSVQPTEGRPRRDTSPVSKQITHINDGRSKSKLSWEGEPRPLYTRHSSNIVDQINMLLRGRAGSRRSLHMPWVEVVSVRIRVGVRPLKLRLRL